MALVPIILRNVEAYCKLMKETYRILPQLFVTRCFVDF